ncbi:MAG: 3-deoxy-manno-octulosonate cytidylyltransferase [Gemmatimonadota bacterium]
MSVLCVLPARLGSERIPRKPLQMIAGRPLVEWCWRAAGRVPEFDEICVATESEEVVARVRAFGGQAVLTAPELASGTDRVAAVARLEGALHHEIVVNFQADEPFVPPESVSRAVRCVAEGEAGIATLAVPVRSDAEWRSEAVVKVVVAADGRALYFSRAPVPHRRGAEASGDGSRPASLRHVGIYVMRRRALEQWTASPPSPLEKLERLEQLRALEAGLPIEVIVGPPAEPGVDVPEDLARAERLLESRGAPLNSESHV